MCNQIHKEANVGVYRSPACRLCCLTHFNFNFFNTVGMLRSTANTSLAWPRPCLSQRESFPRTGLPIARAKCRMKRIIYTPTYSRSALSGRRGLVSADKPPGCTCPSPSRKKDFCKKQIFISFCQSFLPIQLSGKRYTQRRLKASLFTFSLHFGKGSLSGPFRIWILATNFISY